MLPCKAVCGESGIVKVCNVEHWKKYLPDLLQGHEQKTIFNADEMGLFSNLLHNQTSSIKKELYHGGEEEREGLCSFVLWSDVR
jgi:hypothetical protein